MRASTKRLTIWGGVTAIVMLTLLYSFREVAESVDLIQVTSKDLLVSIDDEGETRIRDVFVLSAPTSGNARRITLEVGDNVTMHETLITEIEPSDAEFLNPRSEAQANAEVSAAESNLALAQAQVEQAEAELDFAREERNRARSLIATDAISKRSLDEAERAFRTNSAILNTALAALQVKTFELDRARATLISPVGSDSDPASCLCLPIISPVNGSVLRVLHESEGIVTAGTPLIEIGDPKSIEVVVDLLSYDAVSVRAGQQVVIEEWGGNIPLQGVVRRVEPVAFTRVSSLGIEEQRVNVVIDFSNTSEVDVHLGHGYRVVARIVLSHQRNVLTVPITAVFRDGDMWAVFREQDGRAVLTQVTLGERNSLDVIVTDGLQEGTHVIAYASDQISDGSRIVARNL